MSPLLWGKACEGGEVLGTLRVRKLSRPSSESLLPTCKGNLFVERQPCAKILCVCVGVGEGGHVYLFPLLTELPTYPKHIAY